MESEQNLNSPDEMDWYSKNESALREQYLGEWTAIRGTGWLDMHLI